MLLLIVSHQQNNYLLAQVYLDQHFFQLETKIFDNAPPVSRTEHSGFSETWRLKNASFNFCAAPRITKMFCFALSQLVHSRLISKTDDLCKVGRVHCPKSFHNCPNRLPINLTRNVASFATVFSNYLHQPTRTS